MLAEVRRASWSKRTDRVLLVWDEHAWEDYLWWQAQDRKVLERINLLLKDIQRHGNVGIGKPEALKHDFAGYWSRRITDEHRLVYKITGNDIRIAASRYHYGQARPAATSRGRRPPTVAMGRPVINHRGAGPPPQPSRPERPGVRRPQRRCPTRWRAGTSSSGPCQSCPRGST
jgi:toxin YoeB